MARSYKLLCPIARALDRVGDRWTLLVLRDLHAGPARFVDLAQGLPGIASNLLTSRLAQLQDAALVEHVQGAHGVSLYQLTPLGESTAPLLFSLAQFGAQFPPDDDIKRPGNLRLIAVTLKAALSTVADGHRLNLELRVDGEAFRVDIDGEHVSVLYGPADAPQVTVAVPYEPLVELVDGALAPEEFAKRHLQVLEGDPSQATLFFQLLAEAIGI
ncbi:MAG: helix-turn-helix domain-containing protein [Myxococcota bacterium]